MRPLPATLALVLMLLSSCATTTITRTWRDPSFPGPPLRKVLVCSLSHNDVTRRRLEDAFVQELQADGVTGIQCYNVLPAGKPTGQQVRDAAAAQGVDGMIVTMPAKVKEIPVYGVGPGWAYGAEPGWGPFYDTWDPDWDAVYGTDYVESETRVSLQAKVYAVQPAGRLIWAGTSQTFNPSSTGDLASRIAPRFIDSMARAGVLPPRTTS